jgi:hypothetical protein
MYIFDLRLYNLMPKTCFKNVIKDGINIILLVLEQDINTDILLSLLSKKL